MGTHAPALSVLGAGAADEAIVPITADPYGNGTALPLPMAARHRSPTSG